MIGNFGDEVAMSTTESGTQCCGGLGPDCRKACTKTCVVVGALVELVDEGLLEMGVNEEGETEWWFTEEGEKAFA